MAIDNQSQTKPIRLAPGEVSKRLQAKLKTLYPEKMKNKTMKVKVTDSQNEHVTIFWSDGDTVQQMYEHFTEYEYEHRFAVIVEGDKTYHWHGSVRCRRVFSLAYLTRAATIYCRRLTEPIPLPEFLIINGSAYVKPKNMKPGDHFYDHDALGKEIYDYARMWNESELAELERETEERFAPLPEINAEEQAKREAYKEGMDAVNIRRLEQDRQMCEYLLRIFEGIGEDRKADAAEMQQKMKELLFKIGQRAPLDNFDAVICGGCFQFAEREACVVHDTGSVTQYVCPSCQGNPNTKLYPKDPPLVVQEREAFEFKMNEEGIYIGKNGEHAPLVTRDLLHDCRVSKWWLRLPSKPPKEFRMILRKHGWQWGPGRVQWYHPNQFGILQIPEELFTVYGGYIDGGYCDYRSGRGERLREWAENVRGKAARLTEWSNDIVARYMADGCIVTGGRRTRKLQKEKARAERKAEQARWLDQYAEELQHRANRSEAFQARLASDKMLVGRLETLETDRRLAHKHFDDHLLHDARYYLDRERLGKPDGTLGYSCRTVPMILADYDEVLEKQVIIDEEIALIWMVQEARKASVMEEPETPAAKEIIEAPERSFAVEGVYEVNVGDNRLNLFPTPPELGNMLIRDAAFPSIPQDAKYIIEPHGGTGSLLACLVAHLQTRGIQAEVHTCELNVQLNARLHELGYKVVGENFLDYRPEGFLYDAFVMNPPFDSWLAQVLYALALLRKGGTGHCILPVSFLTSDKPEVVAFRKLVAENGHWIVMERGWFSSSGTDIPVVLVGFRKPEAEEPAPEKAPKRQPVMTSLWD